MGSNKPSPVVLWMQNRDFRTRLTSVCKAQTQTFICGFWRPIMQNSVLSTRITSLYGSQTSPVVLCMQTACLASELLVSMLSQPSSVVFACKTADFWTRITSLYGYKTSPVVLCMHNSAWLAPELQVSMGSSPHLWFCALKTATLELKLHVSMGPRPHLWFCACKTAWFSTRITSLYGSQPSSVVLDAKQRCTHNSVSFCALLAPELLVSMCPCPHLWLLHAKQWILVQSTSLYGYQTSLVVLCMQNGVIYTRMIKFTWVPDHSSVVLCLQNSDFKHQTYKSVWVPVLICSFEHT